MKWIKYKGQGTAVRFKADASLTGWGVSVDQQVDYARWSKQEASLHINIPELLGIVKGLLTFASRLQGQHDQSGIHTQDRRNKESHNVRNDSEYNMGTGPKISHQPDSRTYPRRVKSGSRSPALPCLFQSDKTETTEWQLNKRQFNRIQSKWGPFASHLNNHSSSPIT